LDDRPCGGTQGGEGIGLRRRAQDGGDGKRSLALDAKIAHGFGDHGLLEGLGSKTRVQAEVRAELRNVHPCEPLTGPQGNEGDDPEQDDNGGRQSEKTGKRAPSVEMGTHRPSMVGALSYRTRFSAGPEPWAAMRVVTVELAQRAYRARLNSWPGCLREPRYGRL
jgi:hypothetical protein